MEALTVTPHDSERARDLLRRVHGFDTTAGAARVADFCRDGQVFEVTAGDRLVGAYALRPERHEGASVAWITAAAGGMDGIDGTASLLPAIERQARAMGCAQLGVTTRRRGLVKKLQRHGFQITGLMLRKALT